MIFFSVEKFVEVKTLPPLVLGLSGSPPRLARIGYLVEHETWLKYLNLILPFCHWASTQSLGPMTASKHGHEADCYRLQFG